jgi:class 3 adenylate cyclase/tetratricopeptide (TPR) repeat protein
MEKIDSYLPMDRRQVRGKSLPSITNGAALFADISGFTGYSLNLERELGPQLSTEELTDQLNQVYEALIKPVHDYRGSVISFGGDAIVCWFDRDNGSLATACALEMQEQMSGLGKQSNSVRYHPSLGIKIAVTSGRARRFLVGQPRIQRIEILVGEIINRLAAAEKQLKSGEVVVGSEVMAWFGPEAIINEWRKGDMGEYFAVVERLKNQVEKNPWPEPPQMDLDKASEWLLPPVFHRLINGEEEFLAELRSAVAIFIKFDGINYESDNQSEKKLDAYIGWIQRILAKYQGYVLHVSVGDKGSYLSASFGALITHEDEVDRALTAVMELKSPPDELKFIKNVQIGVTRGRVRVGAYGARSRRTYGIHGNEVNIAAKIMNQAAPQQILTSRRIMEAASSRFDFKKLPPISIKGVDDTFPVYELISKFPKIATDILGRSIFPIIGRREDQETLNEGLEALQDGRSTTVIIEGEAGIGKTRMAEYIIQRARSSGMTALIGAGDEVGKSSLYYAWRPIFNQLFDLDRVTTEGEKESLEDRRRSIYKKLNELSPDLMPLIPLLNPVLPLDFSDNELTLQMTGEVRANNIQVLLYKMLSLVAKSKSLLLVLEDAHWLDSASWALVQKVNREVNPLLLIIVLRPMHDSPPSEYSTLLEDSETKHLRLNVFSRTDLETFILQRLDVQYIPQEVINFIYSRAEGNPFFSEELIITLRDGGYLEVVEGEGRVKSDFSDPRLMVSSDNVQGVIRSRIDRLNPREQETLKISSIIGRVFGYRILNDISPFDKSDPIYLHDYLDNLERLELIQLEFPEPDLAYKFKHNLTWDVAYNSMLFSMRREYHRKIAEWYEINYSEDISEVYPLLAYHWGHTDHGQKAIEFLEKAGVQAVHNFANREALTLLNDALNRLKKGELEISDDRRAQWELMLGEVQVNLGEYLEGRKHLEEGLRLLGQQVPKGNIRQGFSVISQIICQARNRIGGRRYIGKQFAQRDTLLSASRACEKLVEVYFMMNETLLALFAAFRTLNLAEAAGPSSELARGYATVGALLGFIPLHRIALNYLQYARQAIEKLDDLIAKAWVYLVLGFYYAGVGNWQDAADLQGQVVEISKRLGDQRREEDGLGNLFALNYFQGNFYEGIVHAEMMIEISRRRNSELSLAYGLQGKAFISLQQGQFDEAMLCLNELLSLIEKDQSKVADESLKLEMYGLFSLTHLRMGNYKQAIEMAEKSTIFSSKAAPSNYSAFSGYSCPACVYLSLWELGDEGSDMGSLAWNACKLMRKYARVFPIGEPRARLYEGWHHWLSGKQSKAHKAWNDSLASAKNLRMQHDEGLAYFEIGRHLPHNDGLRNKYISQGFTIFNRIGAEYDLTRAKELL